MEQISTSTLLIILTIMILISAYFSASETSLMTLNRYRLRHQSKQGNPAAKRVEQLLCHTDKLLSLLLIGNNLVNIFSSALATIIGLRLYGSLGIAISTGILTFIILLFAEILPKTIASIYPERIAFFSSTFLIFLQKIMLPLVCTLNFITKIIMKIIGIRSFSSSRNLLNKEELRTIFTESQSLLSRKNQDMLISILDLDTVNVKDVMVPRNEIIGIDINHDWRSIVRQLTHSPHGHIVLYRNNLDDLIGILRIREAYRLMTEKHEFIKENLLRAADEIYYIPDSTPLNIQLVKFQRKKEKIGIVVDEYGSIQGLITVGDILEEIVGNFTTSMSSNLVEDTVYQSDGSIIVDGSINIRELNKTFNWNLPEGEARTINGILLEILQDIPVKNTRVHIKNYQFEVLSVQKNMIKQVRIIPKKILFN